MDMRSLMRERVLDLKHDLLIERTKRRQEAAKAALVRRGVVPWNRISTGYAPPHVAASYAYLPVGGVR
jgi:hypothetical protein